MTTLIHKLRSLRLTGRTVIFVAALPVLSLGAASSSFAGPYQGASEFVKILKDSKGQRSAVGLAVSLAASSDKHGLTCKCARHLVRELLTPNRGLGISMALTKTCRSSVPPGGLPPPLAAPGLAAVFGGPVQLSQIGRDVDSYFVKACKLRVILSAFGFIFTSSLVDDETAFVAQLLGTAMASSPPAQRGSFVDVTGDEQRDLIVQTPEGVLIHEFDSSGSLVVRDTLVVDGTVLGVQAVDVDEDGAVDVVIAVRDRLMPGFSVNLFMNDGAGYFGGAIELALPAVGVQYLSGDVNADAIPDSILHDPRTGAVEIFTSTASGGHFRESASAVGVGHDLIFDEGDAFNRGQVLAIDPSGEVVELVTPASRHGLPAPALADTARSVYIDSLAPFEVPVHTSRAGDVIGQTGRAPELISGSIGLRRPPRR